MVWQIVLFVVGLGVLYVGAEAFLKGAAGLARALGVSPFIIGLTIVGFGTSAPELAVNLSAAISGSYDVATGNVVGSNIANIGLILGLAAVIMPLTVQMRLLRIEAPIMLAVALALWLLSLDGELSRVEGVALLLGFLALTIHIFRSARHEREDVKEEISQPVPTIPEQPNIWLMIALLVVGLAGLVGGAELMVRSATEIARGFGVSEMVIGLTIVAVGTSLPELAASAIAAKRGESDVALGNIIGSNIFNVLFILGTTACVHPLPVSATMWNVEMPIMIAFTALLIPFMWWDLIISRREGITLLVAYAGYVGWQIAQTIWWPAAMSGQ